MDPAALKIPSETGALNTARAEIRSLAEQARGLLAGNLSWGSLGTVKNLVDKTRTLMSQHDIEVLSAISEGSDL